MADRQTNVLDTAFDMFTDVTIGAASLHSSVPLF